MARTAPMRLMELLVLKEDIQPVIVWLGMHGNFEFRNYLSDSNESGQNPSAPDPSLEMFEKLKTVRSWLQLDNDVSDVCTSFSSTDRLPSDADFEEGMKLFNAAGSLHSRKLAAIENKEKINKTYTETLSFANLKVPYSELEHLSFLAMRIGAIDPAVYDDLVFAVGSSGIIVPLGDDKNHILAASSKKARFMLDAELKRRGFVPLEIPEGFHGVPDGVVAGLKNELEAAEKALKSLEEEAAAYAKTHRDSLEKLLRIFSLGMQVRKVQDTLESTQLVYRIAGWVPAADVRTIMNELDDLTSGRIAIRQYDPQEVPSVRDGTEKVPVKLSHGKLVGSFERMVFSYGSPLYGAIDPTPIVAFFFTLLFGIMFGDAGQGLVFVLIGILMMCGVIKKFPVSPKFGPIFTAIGCSSVVMGLLTGEFFGNGEILKPFALFVTGLFGNPHAPILHLMPSADSIHKLFYFFLFTVGIGFIINSIGLVINIANQFFLKHPGKALFGKTGLSGALFFWYVVFMAVRISVFKIPVHTADWICIGVTLFGVFFAAPLERLVERRRPVFENGAGTALIEGLVEILEVISSYLSNSVSFLRVGAFALAHAVLGYIIFSMTSLIQSGGGAGSVLGALAVSVLGNAIVIVLEGMIVAIQVVRLQYYEFFSKFFTETGKEFRPFKFGQNAAEQKIK